MSLQAISFLGQRDVLAEGKFLLEILTQLKNFGVGRMVTKNEWARKWPNQPSYCIIKKVSAEMDRWLMHGTMWADFVYRGKPIGIIEFDRNLDRSDWRLIHKKEESTFVKCEKPFVSRQVPSKVPLPPLQRLMYQRRQIRKGNDAKQVPMLPLVHYVDNEHKFLNAFTEFKDELSPNAKGSIYDTNPDIWFDLYGEEIPTKVEGWGSVPDLSEFVVATTNTKV